MSCRTAWFPAWRCTWGRLAGARAVAGACAVGAGRVGGGDRRATGGFCIGGVAVVVFISGATIGAFLPVVF